VSAQLQQILGYLAKDDVREVILAVGRKVAIRQDSGYFSLTAKPLTRDQLATLVRGTGLASLLDGGASKKPFELEIYSKRYRVQVGIHGDDLIMRIDRIPAATAIDLDAPAAPRRKGGTHAPRTKGQTNAPRTKGQTSAPSAARTKTATPRGRGQTNAPRAKGQTSSPPPPRTKAPSATQRAKAPSDTPSNKRSRQPSSISLDLGDLDLGVADTIGIPSARPAAPAARQPAAARPAPGEPVWEVVDTDFELEGDAPGFVPELAPAGVLPPKAGRGPVLPPKRSGASASTSTQSFVDLVREASEKHASDLHIAAGRPIQMRIAGQLVQLAAEPLAAADAEALLLPLLDELAAERLGTSGYVDLAIETAGAGRVRANISRHQGGLKGSFRIARATPPTLEELGLPAAVAKVVGHHQGLVVIAGPSGHGKTTTLSALVDLLNSTRAYHILTIEDPIEIVYPRKQAVVSQREAGRHTKSFATALKASLREDPDVIVIGELRDRESVEIALTAAETGHLVLATMSTPSAAKTLDRLIDMFPPDEHTQVRASIAGALRAIIAQRLVPAKQGGVMAAIELVTGVLPLATLIRDDKLYQLPSLMQRGRAFGMIRFDESLAELVKSGKVTEEAALPFAENKKLFARPA
jgi:twitching motility protein PilT